MSYHRRCRRYRAMVGFGYVRRALRWPVVPGAVRTIEYEIVPRGLAPIVLARNRVPDNPRNSEPVAVLKCIDSRGAKVTVVGSADHFEELLQNGAARDPSGVTLPREHFPHVIDGWPTAS